MPSEYAKMNSHTSTRGMRKINSETNFAVSLLLAVSGRTDERLKRPSPTIATPDAGSEGSSMSIETREGMDSRHTSESPASTGQQARTVRLARAPPTSSAPLSPMAVIRDRQMTPEERKSALQRHAALVRFREKKRRRQFQKKVRYLVRKRLAESRPRYKGRFSKPPAPQPDGSGADSKAHQKRTSEK